MEETLVSATPKKPSKKERLSHRIWEIDFLRGLAILLMLFDHLMYDFTLLPGLFPHNFYLHVSQIAPALNEMGIWWFYISPLRYVGHVFFVGVFALIVGISCSFSRSNLKRGALLLLFALFISGVTLLADHVFNMGLFVVFGILHTFAISIFLYSLLRLLPYHRIVMLAVGSAIVVLFFIFGTGVIPSIDFLEHPSVLNYLKIAVG
ncbi:MAG: heparan-alpha-glucosaminide N-acetyltransferase domain-containing protein, partial [Firmicutes bacterium]|nr:heparan-alpha-glucosaminide N-acetyltransferase domain-containing protein [Bacillota bacterium]